MEGVTGARDQERSAVLVVRAWRRLDDATVVARITSSADVTAPDRVVVVQTGVEAIVQVVREWLAEVRDAGGA
jgi:hypothetical protein